MKRGLAGTDIFDTIIVGAGSAGCVLANRLSADPKHRVLLVEAGGWGSDAMISTPMLAGEITKRNLYNWADTSEPDEHLEGRRSIIPHGKVIGGSSSINYLAFTRGHPMDYHRWEQAGAKGWSYPEVLPFFREVESWQRGPDAWRGGQGEVGVVQPDLQDPIAPAWLEAARRNGIPFSKDLNGADPEGISPIQYSSSRGRRSSAGRVFLRPVLKRPNLDVRTEACVTKLHFEGRRAVAVEYEHGRARHLVRATKRIVLCLGAINTPHLLMLSGVGPADHLRSHGIDPVVDLPVGQGLEDHLGIEMAWSRRGMSSFYKNLRIDRIIGNMSRASLFGTGPFASLPPVFMAFVRSREGLSQPDLELLLSLPMMSAGPWFPGIAPPAEDAFGAKAYLLAQESRGEIRLRSPNPADRPLIFYNSLSAPEDLERLRAGFKLIRSIVEDPAIDPFRGPSILPVALPVTDAEIDAFVRSTACQQYHPAATCRMGDGPDAVLDARLGVRGLEGLHVVDASAMPHLVSSNPNSAIMMMAARAASLWR